MTAAVLAVPVITVVWSCFMGWERHSADAWRAFFILYSRVEDGVSPALQERFAEITLSIHYIR